MLVRLYWTYRLSKSDGEIYAPAMTDYSQVSPLENHGAAVSLGDQLAKQFIRDN